MNWEPTGKKILITGYTGLVGSTLTDEILKDKIVGISRGKTKPPNKPAHNLKFIHIDLSKTSLNQLMQIIKRSGCDLILHLAALNGDRCQQNPKEAEQINWSITYKLAILCKKIKIPLGFCSTADVFSRFGGPYSEEDPTGIIYDSQTKILNVYSWTKYRAENTVIKLLFKDHLGFIFRLAYPYNPSYTLKPGTVVSCFNTLAIGGIWTVVKNMNMNPISTFSIVSILNKLILSKVWKYEDPIFHIAQKEILTSSEIAQICCSELKKRGINVDTKKQIKIVNNSDFFKISPRQIPGGVISNKITKLGLKIPNFRDEVKNFPLILS